MTDTKAVYRIGLAVLFTATIVLAPNASASVIGQLDVANCAGAGVLVTATTIDWLPAGGGAGCIVTGVPTNVTTSAGTLSPGVTGSIKDLAAPTTFPVIDFMTFTGLPALHFDLSALGPGPANTGCAAAFDPNLPACSVATGSPFILSPTSTGTSVTLSATGIARDGTTPTSTWLGAFTTQIAGQTPAQIQATILGGGSEMSTYSGDFRVTLNSAVPEPSTLGSMLLGGLLIAAGYFRRRTSV